MKSQPFRLPKVRFYDKEWALGVFQAFREKYTRATDKTLQYYKLLPQNIAKLIYYQPRRWERFKKFVKCIEKFLSQRMIPQEYGDFIGPAERVMQSTFEGEFVYDLYPEEKLIFADTQHLFSEYSEKEIEKFIIC